MAIHVAILQRGYVEMILDGAKTVESRLTRTARPPFGVIEPGQRIFIKASGGPFMATAVAQKVDSYSQLTPKRIEQLWRRFNHAVCGDAGYWRHKRDSRFATFITLGQIQPLDIGPRYNKSLQAWHVLDDECSPLLDVTLTDGAIRNCYVRLTRASEGLRRNDITLVLPDGSEIQTQLTSGSMIRWRGWGRYYCSHGIEAGDVVRFVAIGPRRYRVTFLERK